MASEERNCFLAVNGKKYGPMSEKDIQKLYTGKKIADDAKFARKGYKKWVPLSQSGVIVVAAPAPVDQLPPPPPENPPSTAKITRFPFTIVSAGVAVFAVIAGFFTVSFLSVGDATLDGKIAAYSACLRNMPNLGDCEYDTLRHPQKVMEMFFNIIEGVSGEETPSLIQLTNQNHDLIRMLEQEGVLDFSEVSGSYVAYDEWHKSSSTPNLWYASIKQGRVLNGGVHYESFLFDFYILINSPTDYYIRDIRTVKE